MEYSFTILLLALQVALFACALLLDFARRNAELAWIYALQSLVITAMLLALGWQTQSYVLFAIVFATLLIKVVIVPRVLLRLIKKHELTFAAAAHLNTPMVLMVTLALVLAVRSSIAPVFTDIVPGAGNLLYLVVSAFFVSLFLAVNRYGAFSQIAGILSAENCLVAFAALMNIHTELWLELGILVDIFAWMLIGSTFVSIVHRHFGSTDISRMKELAE